MMNCDDTTIKLHPYFDNRLEGAVAAEIEEHLVGCNRCRELYSREVKLRLTLKGLRTQVPDAIQFNSMIEHAVKVNERKQRNNWLAMGFGSAIAAGLAGWLAIGIVTSQPHQPTPAEIAGLTINLYETRNVNLVFNSSDELQDALVSLRLPPGFEIAGFPGQQQIKWITTVREGKNLLTLPLIAKQQSSGELLALVEHGAKHKTFRLHLTVGPDGTT